MVLAVRFRSKDNAAIPVHRYIHDAPRYIMHDRRAIPSSSGRVVLFFSGQSPVHPRAYMQYFRAFVYRVFLPVRISRTRNDENAQLQRCFVRGFQNCKQRLSRRSFCSRRKENDSPPWATSQLF